MVTGLMRLCSRGERLDIVVETAQDSGLSAHAKSATNTFIRFKARRLSLPAEELSTIFEPFQHLEIPSLNGTLGLGLTLARAIAVQHGGTCGADSGARGADYGASGGGTTLWLQIPN
jgi:K+-sensing histidine kinase KdpD